MNIQQAMAVVAPLIINRSISGDNIRKRKRIEIVTEEAGDVKQQMMVISDADTAGGLVVDVAGETDCNQSDDESELADQFTKTPYMQTATLVDALTMVECEVRASSSFSRLIY